MLFWLSLIAAGSCLCITIYLVLSPGLKSTSSTQFNLPRLRVFLPWIEALSALVSPFLTWKYQLKIKQEIVLAGLSGQLTYQHVAGMQLAGAIVVFSGAFTVAVSLLSMPLTTSLLSAALFLFFGAYWPLASLRSLTRQRQRLILKGFPFLLDMTTLCVESGLNLHGALIQAAKSIPEGPLREELRHALNEMRAGVGRTDALRDMAQRVGLMEVKQWIATISQAESLGMGLGVMLRAQADQRRSERFLRAEKLALEAPVKMLFPLVICIFPCTFIVLAFPIGMKLLNSGL